MRTPPDFAVAGRGRPHPVRILANALLIAAVGAALLSSCAKEHDATPAAGEARTVTALTFTTGATGGAIVVPGRIRAEEEVTLTARLAARLTSLRAREGARVRRGDVIAIFDAPETRRALAASRAELASAELAAVVASRQAARMDSLFASQVISARDREMAESQQRAAQAQLEAARSMLEMMTSGSSVRAPFDGVVVRVHVDPGADMSPGAPLVDLRSDGGVELECDVPEDAASRLAASTLAMQVGNGAWRPARLVRLEGMTDWRSRSRTARLRFAGSAEPGAFARLAIGGTPGEAGDGSVSRASLVARGALSGVFVLEDGRAHLRWLKLGRSRGERVEVLSGLEPGERYASVPDSLRDGAAVTIRP